MTRHRGAGRPPARSGNVAPLPGALRACVLPGACLLLSLALAACGDGSPANPSAGGSSVSGGTGSTGGSTPSSSPTGGGDSSPSGSTVDTGGSPAPGSATSSTYPAAPGYPVVTSTSTSPDAPIPPLPDIPDDVLLRYMPTAYGSCPDEAARLPGSPAYAALRLHVSDLTAAPLVQLTVDGATQVAHIDQNNVCGSYQGIVTFDLGTSTAASGRLDITWADGTPMTIPGLPLDAWVTLKQPSLGLAQTSGLTPAQLDDAINRVIGWFNSRDPKTIKPDAFIILRRLQAMYGLTGLHLPTDPAAGPDLTDPEMQAFTRLYDASHVWDDSLGGMPGLDQATLPALYCNDYALPADFRDRLMTQMAEKGGYLASHALLAYALVRSNACDSSFLPDADLARLLIINLALMNDPIDYYSNSLGQPEIQDLRVEIMAVLASLGRQDLIPASFFQDMLGRQLPEGGWSVYLRGNVSDSHTSMLALWLLLQVRELDRNFAPFVVRRAAP